MADEVAVPVRGALRRAKLHRPATRTHGTIVFVHGSGEATVDDFAWYTDQLTDLGIACLVVDKVMDGYSQTRRHYDALADDAGDALRWARQQPDTQIWSIWSHCAQHRWPARGAKPRTTGRTSIRADPERSGCFAAR